MDAIFLNKKLIHKNIDGTDLYYREDTHDYSILSEIWRDKVYAKYFPFGKKSTIIDIGSHNGYFSLWASKFLHSDSKIFSYEPVKENFDVFAKNVEVNDILNIYKSMIAVTSKTGFINLYLSKIHTGGHSVLRDRINVYGKESFIIEEVPSTSFSDILRNVNFVDFCKIDCEGGEFDIILNTPQKDINKVSVFAIEFHEFGGYKVLDLVNIFENYGYETNYSFSPSKRGIKYGILWSRQT